MESKGVFKEVTKSCTDKIFISQSVKTKYRLVGVIFAARTRLVKFAHDKEEEVHKRRLPHQRQTDIARVRTSFLYNSQYAPWSSWLSGSATRKRTMCLLNRESSPYENSDTGAHTSQNVGLLKTSSCAVPPTVKSPAPWNRPHVKPRVSFDARACARGAQYT